MVGVQSYEGSDREGVWRSRPPLEQRPSGPGRPNRVLGQPFQECHFRQKPLESMFLLIELTCVGSGCTERALCWGSRDSV